VKDSGIEGLVNSALWLERVAGTETLSLGHSAFSLAECAMELAGRSLSYWAELRGGWIWISVREMDNASDHPDIFFNLADGPEGWARARRFIAALERSGIKTLQPRPIRIGAPEGPNSFVIG
jgi:hypothetical protein